MNTKPMMKTQPIDKRLIAMLLGLAILFISPFASSTAFALQTDDQSWTSPVNLSQSGSTNTPLIVADATGTIHAIWTDEFAGSMYAAFSSGSWSSAAQIDFPFDDFIPLLNRRESVHLCILD